MNIERNGIVRLTQIPGPRMLVTGFKGHDGKVWDPAAYASVIAAKTGVAADWAGPPLVSCVWFDQMGNLHTQDFHRDFLTAMEGPPSALVKPPAGLTFPPGVR